jgi:hypothetical protein
MDAIFDGEMPRARLAVLLKHFSQIDDDRESWRVVYPLGHDHQGKDRPNDARIIPRTFMVMAVAFGIIAEPQAPIAIPFASGSCRSLERELIVRSIDAPISNRT